MRWWAEMTSFVRSYMRGARFLVFFPSSNKFNGFHIYNTLVSQISIEILGYFHQLSPFPHCHLGYALPSTGRPSLAVLRHVGVGGHRRRGRHRGHVKLGAIVYSARAVKMGQFWLACAGHYITERHPHKLECPGSSMTYLKFHNDWFSFYKIK